MGRLNNVCSILRFSWHPCFLLSVYKNSFRFDGLAALVQRQICVRKYFSKFFATYLEIGS